MVKEIYNNQDNLQQSIHSLPSMKYAKKQEASNEDYSKFIQFGHKFAVVIRKRKYEHWWSAGHILKDLLLLEQNEAGNQRYHEAKDAFRKTIKIHDSKQHKKDGNKSWTLCIGLARTLHQLNENEEAEHYFKLAVSMNMQRGNKQFYEAGHFYYAAFLQRNNRRYYKKRR